MSADRSASSYVALYPIRTDSFCLSSPSLVPPRSSCFHLDLNQSSRCRFATHDKRSAPLASEYESWIECFPAHRIMSGAERSSHDHGDLPGTTEFDTAFTIIAPALMMPLTPRPRPTMKPFTSWKKMSGIRF